MSKKKKNHRLPNILKKDDDLIFQIVDWDNYDEDGEDDDGEDIQNFMVRLYGILKTESGERETICVKVEDFKPYFYVDIPDFWKRSKVRLFVGELKRRVDQDYRSSLINYKIVSKCKFYGFTNYKKFRFVKLIFSSYAAFREYRLVLYRKIKNMLLYKYPRTYKMYESNIEPMLRMMHHRNLVAGGWVKIKKDTYYNLSKNERMTYDNVNICTSYTNLEKYESDDISKFLIASFDIECYSCDGNFPQANRDKDAVIQIGTTFNYFGDINCFYKHIITLDSCDPIDGVDVESYETEQEVLLAWTELIKRMNPDIITGYNTFGFDYRYMHDRANKLGCENRFSRLGRLINKPSKYTEKRLNSSGLGNNNLYYYATKGRIQIDLYKVIQSDVYFKFSSYKLDYVSSKFIRNNIKDIIIRNHTTKIITKGTAGLTGDRYIKIYYNDRLDDNVYHNHHKYKVRKIGKDFIVIKGKLNNDIIQNDGSRIKLIDILKNKDGKFDKYKVFWCQAKDDMKYSDIFKMQKGTSADRAKVATYCIAEGTPVMLRNYSDKIENLGSKCKKNEIISWDNNEDGLIVSSQNKFFDNGEKECIELLLEDGRTLTCTKDHKILTSENEWVEAGNLKPSKTKVKIGFTYPKCNVNEEIDMYSDWEFMSMDLTYRKEYNKTMAFMRILGYVMTDGSITKDRANLYMGTRIDAENISRDIELICGESYKIRKTKHTYNMTIPRYLSKKFLKIPGIAVGRRVNQDIKFPDFILDKDCPLPVIREFLGGLFGGDGHTTCFSKNNKFSGIGFSQTKTINKLGSLKNFLQQLSDLLMCFGIESTTHSPRNVKTSDKEKHASIYLNVRAKHIPLFAEKIGFKYCVDKSFKLAVVSSYYKKREVVLKQSEYVTEKTIKYKGKYHTKLKSKEVIFNEHYSLPGYKCVQGRIQNGKMKKIVYHKYFPSAKDFLIMTGTLKNFTGDMKITHAVDKEDSCIPTFNLTVIGIRNVGMKKVYDIEVNNTHSYLANGIVLHNCVQDCTLCNIIIEKLQTLTNNINMANVSNVPLQYIFLRGQGIKILSVVSKKCRERNHLIPYIRYRRKIEEVKEEDELTEVVDDNYLKLLLVNCKEHGLKPAKMIRQKKEKKKRGKKKDKIDLEGYEGATVLRPEIKVHFNPIAVLDYGSLYPSSMIHRNISHECLVLDDQYDNLPGYKYYDITFYNNDGTTTTRKYAKNLDGTLGIIPEILKDLLDARNIAKREMTTTKDPLKKKVYNGKQMALKVTANSVYGQTGARTSAIYLRDIAASTTATGREMLNLARIFSEEIFPLLVLPALVDNYKLYKKRIKLLFNKQIDELLGERTIRRLKKTHYKDNNDRDDNNHLKKPDDYYYLRVFQERDHELTDDIFAKYFKYMNKHFVKNFSEYFDTVDLSEYTTKKDFFKYFYDAIRIAIGSNSIAPECVYGDTDSVFIDQKIRNLEDKFMQGRDGRKIAINISVLGGDLMNFLLPSPQKLVYEKTLHPLALFTKKRYAGLYHEYDPDNYFLKVMGIVLKRRDNAPIVKIVYGGVLRKILEERSPKEAIEFLKQALRDIFSSKYPLEKFVITKTIRGNALTAEEREYEIANVPKDERPYKNRGQLAHVSLADKMADRDPGNKPQSNDRIPYVYIITDKKCKLQRDRIEHTDYVIEHGLKLDYLFYITNQIMIPVIQILDKILDSPPEKLFESYIVREVNRRHGKRTIQYYLNSINNDSDDESDNVFCATLEDDVVSKKVQQIYNKKKSRYRNSTRKRKKPNIKLTVDYNSD